MSSRQDIEAWWDFYKASASLGRGFRDDPGDPGLETAQTACLGGGGGGGGAPGGQMSSTEVWLAKLLLLHFAPRVVAQQDSFRLCVICLLE